jgi:tetratricopeptide (TPR) repeat protein
VPESRAGCIALLGIALVACSPALRIGYVRSRPSWVEFKSEHFILDTNVNDEDAATIMANFEALRAADLKVLAGDQVDFAGRIRLFVPASPSVFLELAGGTEFVGWYTHHNSWTEPVIVAPGSLAVRRADVVAHELAHAISYYIFPEQRIWFSEGLAEFVETLGRASVAADPEVRASGSAGDVPSHLKEFVGNDKSELSAADVLVAKGVGVPPRRVFYGQSWLLYHWLYTTRGNDLRRFQQRLADGEAWDESWRAVFPELDPANPEQMRALDEMLLAYRKVVHAVGSPIEAREKYWTTPTPLSPAQVRLWLLILRHNGTEKKEDRLRREREQVEKALVEDPSNLVARIWLIQIDRTLTAADVRKMLWNAPRDYFGWLKLSALTPLDEEKEAALRKSIALAPDCADCNNSLAWHLVQTGRAKEALPYANRAVDLAPWQAAYVDTLGAVALQLGQCPQALALQTRANRMEVAIGPMKEKLEARLKAVQDRCAKK